MCAGIDLRGWFWLQEVNTAGGDPQLLAVVVALGNNLVRES